MGMRPAGTSASGRLCESPVSCCVIRMLAAQRAVQIIARIVRHWTTLSKVRNSGDLELWQVKIYAVFFVFAARCLQIQSSERNLLEYRSFAQVHKVRTHDCVVQHFRFVPVAIDERGHHWRLFLGWRSHIRRSSWLGSRFCLAVTFIELMLTVARFTR